MSGTRHNDPGKDLDSYTMLSSHPLWFEPIEILLVCLYVGGSMILSVSYNSLLCKGADVGVFIKAMETHYWGQWTLMIIPQLSVSLGLLL